MKIYKIMTDDDYKAFESLSELIGSSVDLSDGYIHFSTGKQLLETAKKHFYGKTNLHLVWAEHTNFGEDLVWEISRGGVKFPHLYRKWHFNEVEGNCLLPWEKTRHVFPTGHP